MVRARVHLRSFWIGGAALLAALAATAGPAAAEQGNAPIAISVVSSLEGQHGLSRILSSAGTGDTADTAREVEDLLGRLRWGRLTSNEGEAEALVSIDSRERVERGRSYDKKGKVTVNHRYRADATVEVARRRVQVHAEQDFSEGPYSTRDDDDQFKKVAEKLVDEIGNAILANLDELRPERPDAGFDHAVKHKLLFKGDGLEVKDVAAGSPAAQAGLQVKDRIRRIDDEKGTDQMDYRVRTWWVEAPGTRVAMEVERNKVRQVVQLTLAPRNQWGGAAPAPTAAHAAFTPPPSHTSAGAKGGTGVELKPGMTELDVAKLLGQPREKVAFGSKSLWRYDGYSVTFQNGRVTDIK